jgi:hypothetical protein
MLFALADRLHKTVAEIENLTLDEIAEWRAYCKIRKEQEDR